MYIPLILLQLFHFAFCYPTSRAVSSTSKAGLAWGGGDGANINDFTATGKVSWYYTWSPDDWVGDTSLEFVPMLWGSKSVSDFTANINQTIGKGNVKAVLGMNEPEQAQQSNLTPQQGADLWKTYLEPLRSQGIRLGSPAPSSAPSGKIWLQNFLTTCAGGCTVDFIAFHWYDVNATAFIEYVQDFQQTFQKPLWITEWACQNYNNVNQQCSQDDVVLFLNKTQSFMDSADFVERYAWFGAMENLQGVNQDDALMDEKGNINALGKQYIGAAPPPTTGSGNADGPNAPGGGGGGDGTPFISKASRAS